jgi:hypothetical protein
MKVRGLVLALLLVATPARAADVDGTWNGNIVTPQGEVAVGFTFKADGATLTGTTAGPDGTQVAIKDGKVNGSNITFAVAFDFGGMPFELLYTGVVSPAEIKMTIDFMGMPVELLVKKAVPAAGAK